MKKCVGCFGFKECTWILCNDYPRCQLKYWENKLKKKDRHIEIQKIKEAIKFRKNIYNK